MSAHITILGSQAHAVEKAIGSDWTPFEEIVQQSQISRIKCAIVLGRMIDSRRIEHEYRKAAPRTSRRLIYYRRREAWQQ